MKFEEASTCEEALALFTEEIRLTLDRALDEDVMAVIAQGATADEIAVRVRVQQAVLQNFRDSELVQLRQRVARAWARGCFSSRT